MENEIRKMQEVQEDQVINKALKDRKSPTAIRDDLPGVPRQRARNHTMQNKETIKKMPKISTRNQTNAQEEMKEKYFEKQIQGLIIILEENKVHDMMVARTYVIEKLNMILRGGINFHPLIKEKLQ